MNMPEWYYKAMTQVIFVGMIAFCCPGLFNALSGLGAAGQSNPDDANMANASLYAFFTVFGYFGGFFFNIMGNVLCLACGGAFYAIYAVGMYISGNIESAGWVAILVGALLGIGAGWFWTAQGAMMIAYATPETKGHYIAIFWVLFNLGGFAGGMISFGVNYHTTVSEANPASYFTFVGLMALGALSALFLICNPNKVIRKDGAKVELEKAPSAMSELKGAAMVITDKYMLLMTVYFFASNFYYTYQFNFVNGKLFNIRTRGLNSAIYWAAQMLAAYLIGIVLDVKTTRQKRGWYGLLFTVGSFVAAFGAGSWLQYGFEGGYDKDRPIIIPIDFTDSSRAAGPIIIYVLYGFADATIQSYAYWLMGALAGTNTTMCARYAGYYKGIQSLGACMAWGLDLCDSMLYEYQFWMGVALFAIGTPLCGMAVKTLPKMTDHEIREIENDLEREKSVRSEFRDVVEAKRDASMKEASRRESSTVSSHSGRSEF